MSGHGGDHEKMYFVCIIKSDKLDKNYIGYTNNLTRRLRDHNQGLSKYTRRGIPWKLMHREEYTTKSLALKREKQLKSWKNKRAIDRLCKREN